MPDENSDAAPFRHRWEYVELHSGAPRVERLTVPGGWLYCIEGHPPVFVYDESDRPVDVWSSQMNNILAALGLKVPRGELVALDSLASQPEPDPEDEPNESEEAPHDP